MSYNPDDLYKLTDNGLYAKLEKAPSGETWRHYLTFTRHIQGPHTKEEDRKELARILQIPEALALISHLVITIEASEPVRKKGE